jgi:hypothetical protein
MKQEIKNKQIVKFNGQEYVVVRMWKDGRVRLNDVRYPSLYVITRVEYL